jgi:hypothetical protein
MKMNHGRQAVVGAVFLGALGVLGAACSSGKISGRDPSSAGFSPPDFRDGVMNAITELQSQVSGASFDSRSCVPFLRELEAGVRALTPSEIQDRDLRSRPGVVIDGLWKLQLALHSRLPEVDRDCAIEMRNTFRLVRFLVDYLGERMNQVQPVDPSKVDFKKIPTPIREQAPHYQLLVADSGAPVEFLPGDIMISRGISYLSALISRIGSVDSQFSHIVFVDRDPSTRKAQTIESYVGEGVRFYDMDFALRNENARLLLLRSRDRGLAARAAKFMHGKVASAIASGKPIPYDYEFDFEDHSALSCAEVARYAYEEASEGRVIIPAHPSRIVADKTFLDRFQLHAGETFEPADVELDPRFEIVAEFRDLSLTRDSRMKDVILSEMLRWVNELNYGLMDTGKSKFAGGFVWPARRTIFWPLVRTILGLSDFSKDIPKPVFKSFALLNQVGEGLLKELRKRDAEFEKRTGWAMTYVDLTNELEKLRREDLQVYINPDTRYRSKLHYALRPKDLKVKPRRPPAPMPGRGF